MVKKNHANVLSTFLVIFPKLLVALFLCTNDTAEICIFMSYYHTSSELQVTLIGWMRRCGLQVMGDSVTYFLAFHSLHWRSILSSKSFVRDFPVFCNKSVSMCLHRRLSVVICIVPGSAPRSVMSLLTMQFLLLRPAELQFSPTTLIPPCLRCSSCTYTHLSTPCLSFLTSQLWRSSSTNIYKVSHL